MSSRSSGRSRRLAAAAVGSIWSWRRRIRRDEQEWWLAELQHSGFSSWVLSEKPSGSTSQLTAYVKSRAQAIDCVRRWGGRAEIVSPRQWLPHGPAKPLSIGSKLQIFHKPARTREASRTATLHIPHGLAFGSGEHATTSMLLRALARQPHLERRAILDLGTGSGILALAARRLGARRIVALDSDAQAVRTARQNEERNFSSPLIRWRRGDVRKLPARNRYHLVLANLFSGILCQGAGPISGSIAAGGELWLSGILRTQEQEVVEAYERQQLQLLRTKRRGKWIMQQWRRTGADQA